MFTNKTCLSFHVVFCMHFCTNETFYVTINSNDEQHSFIILLVDDYRQNMVNHIKCIRIYLLLKIENMFRPFGYIYYVLSYPSGIFLFVLLIYKLTFQSFLVWVLPNFVNKQIGLFVAKNKISLNLFIEKCWKSKNFMKM